MKCLSNHLGRDSSVELMNIFHVRKNAGAFLFTNIIHTYTCKTQHTGESQLRTNVFKQELRKCSRNDVPFWRRHFNLRLAPIVYHQSQLIGLVAASIENELGNKTPKLNAKKKKCSHLTILAHPQFHLTSSNRIKPGREFILQLGWYHTIHWTSN